MKTRATRDTGRTAQLYLAGAFDRMPPAILHGIAQPVSSDLGYMPAFKDSMSDDQVAELVTYLRRQFAPDKAAWSDIHAAVGRLREQPLLRW